MNRFSSDSQIVSVGRSGADPNAMWHACSFPERPPDANTMYHVSPHCHGCNIAHKAAKRAGSVEDFGSTEGAKT